MTTTQSQTPDLPQTCDRCHEPLSERAIALGWPVSVAVPGSHGQDHEYICPSCYGDDGVCSECGEIIGAYEGDTCPCTHTYDVRWHDGSGVTDEIEADSLDEACETACDMAGDTEWGPDGAHVTATVSEYDSDGDEIDSREISVDIEPDHSALIREVMWDGYQLAGCGASPDDHDWTSEGEGGCDDNPGVWSLGGTTYVYASHCTRCGLQRSETYYGSQRDPGQSDTVEYSAPSEEPGR